MTCPPVHELEAFLRGQPAPPGISMHLEGCAACQQRCEDIAANNELFEQIRDLSPEPLRSPEARDPDLGLDGYSDLCEIRRGGQGIVYRAFHRPTNRSVAIKVLIRGSLAAAKERRRFEREIDIVASFHHPNIVTVYDSGSTGDGRRFVAMEYINGVTIDQWGRSVSERSEINHPSVPRDGRRARRLSPQLRHVLERFAQVCDGVSYAHQRGVIHRDLKPGNILVASDETPRILDFGLAKVESDADGFSQVTLTQPGHFLGTLAYAAPEQVSANHGEMDVRTDVHALGLILYQLLSGELPYDATGAVVETVRNIAERDPRPLRSEAGSSRYEIDGELETIVFKAISKPKERRYQTAEQLKSDVLAYLEGDAIDAKRDSTWYVLRKTMHRHRVSVGAAAVLFLVLATFGVSMTVFSGALARQRDAARAARVRAETEALKAEKINEVIERIFTSVRPAASRGEDVSVREVLRASAPWVDRELGDVPEVQAEVRRTIGITYQSIGEYENARTEIQHSVDALVRTFGTDDPRTLSAEILLARVHLALGELDTAEGIAREVLESQRRILEPDDATIIATQRTLAEILNARGHWEESREIFEDALESANSAPGLDELEQIRLEQGLAGVLGNMSEWEESTRLLTQSRTRLVALLGEDHPESLRASLQLAELLRTRNELEESATLYDQSLQAQERVLGAEHPLTLATARTWAQLLLDMGRYEEASARFEQTVEAQGRVLGAEHPDTLETTHEHAGLLSLLGRYGEAESLERRVLEIRTRRFGRDHPGTIKTLFNLATTLWDQRKQLDDAEAMYRDALERQTRIAGEEHVDTLAYSRNFALLLQDQGHRDEAETLYKKTIDLQRRTVGEDHPETLETMSNLAMLYSEAGDYDSALPLARATLDARRRTLGDEDEQTLVSMNNLADLYVRLEKPGEAEALYETLVDAAQRALPPDHIYTAIFRGNFGRFLVGRSVHDDKAEGHLRAAYETTRAAWGDAHPYTTRFRNALIELYEARGQSEMAQALRGRSDD